MYVHAIFILAVKQRRLNNMKFAPELQEAAERTNCNYDDTEMTGKI